MTVSLAVVMAIAMAVAMSVAKTVITINKKSQFCKRYCKHMHHILNTFACANKATCFCRALKVEPVQPSFIRR
jgi:hypothetical protein